ncbi:MAG TPA: rhodanese-like domain-containing protein [Kiritimatiellia bacterium]|jgi:rhodanese-related sulfurtransferase|nr:rhodanese-like domain-containing protein [Lentisphaerota bacterium]HRV30700.1 rhodanese-like domain-containing protein [Kiritimatiellia bacterium]
MSQRTMALPQKPLRAVAGAVGWILLLAVALSVAVNFLRPATSRLPWVSDWDRHIETQAFRAGIPVVFLPGVRERLERSTVVFLDARSPDDYALGHLPGAYSMPLEDMERALGDYVAILTPGTPLVVYCGDTDCSDGLDLAVKLVELGFQEVSLYPGGYAEWTEYGGAIQTGEQP